MGEFAASIERSKAVFQLTRGSDTGPRWGLRLQTPVIGRRSARLPWPPLSNPKYATGCVVVLGADGCERNRRRSHVHCQTDFTERHGSLPLSSRECDWTAVERYRLPLRQRFLSLIYSIDSLQYLSL